MNGAREQFLTGPAFAQQENAGVRLGGALSRLDDALDLLAFPDEAALAKSWESFRADPDWQAGRAASEVDGKLVAKATSTILHSTDYSPMK